MNQKQKINLFLYLKFNNRDNIKYTITPSPDKIFMSDDGLEVISFGMNPDDIFLVNVTVNEIKLQSSLIIEKIVLNDIQLNHLDSFGRYLTSHGVRKTYGFMDEAGSYKFKIRYNAISQNYLNFLLNK